MRAADAGTGHCRLRREVNERVADVNRYFARGESDLGSIGIRLLCECDDPMCVATPEMTLAEYEAVRAQPDQLIVATVHEVRSDAIVARRNGYVVVEHPSDSRALVSWLHARRDARSQSPLSSER